MGVQSSMLSILYNAPAFLSGILMLAFLPVLKRLEQDNQVPVDEGGFTSEEVEEQNRYHAGLDRYDVLQDSGKYMGNLFLRDWARYLLFMPGVWIVLFFVANAVELDSMQYIRLLFTPILLGVLPLFYYMGYDKRLLKKYNLQVKYYSDFAAVKRFKILRNHGVESALFRKYCIVDAGDNSLICFVQNTVFLGCVRCLRWSMNIRQTVSMVIPCLATTSGYII